jgi:hypothetical protein
MWTDDYDGRMRRKKRGMLPDGARANFAMQMMDQASYGFTPKFADGSVDHTNPHRPGHRFADVDDAGRLAADAAYEARRQAMHYANRRQQQDACKPEATHDLDRLRELADAAYEDRKVRMQNAWRNR